MRRCLLFMVGMLLGSLSGFVISPAVAITKVDMANSLEEGKRLGREKEQKEQELRAIESRKQDVFRAADRADQKMMDFNRRAESFNRRCGRDFRLPQEQAEYNWCAQQNARDIAEFKGIQDEQAAAMRQAEQLRSEQDRASRQLAEASGKFQNWQNRMKAQAISHSPKLSECFLNSSGTASETIVSSYERCWDLAGEIPATRVADPSNDPMVVKPDPPTGTRRTQQQAIDEFEKSGRETPGPNTLKKGLEPPSPINR